MSIIVDCPSCGGKLRVPDELLGRRVKCPKCRLEFQAGAAASPPAAAPSLGPSAELPPPEPHVPPTSSAATPPPPDQPSEDERPWEQPYRPYRAGVRHDCEPHRGTMILVFGILSLVFMGIIGLPLGIAAWVMGHKDLQRMRNREMDPEGLGTTQAGWVCGIIGTILGGLLSVCTCMYIVFVFAAMWAAVTTLPPPPPPTPPPAPGNFQGGGLPLALADYVPRLRW